MTRTPSGGGSPREPRVVQIRAYGSRLEAEVAQSVLTAAGIPSALETDDADGALPILDVNGVARLLVNEPWAAQASALLDGVEDRGGDPGQ